ncbi:MAG TPA: hypothetical protein VG963_07495, partial [Polyangiaceae bacterium]|nr:hypothetical protein [Polyangiaceae bacterium]
GFDEYVRRAEAYPAAVEAYEEAAIAAARPLAVALRGLYHQACGVRNEAYKLGFAVYQGVGFIYECERGTGAVAGTALSAYGLAHDNPVAACIALAESGELTARHAVALVLLLRKQPETVTEKPATVWDRIKRLAAKREQDAEFAARGGPPMTQTERDVIKATELQERVWPGGTPTNIVNHELDRKAREAEAQRRAERQAEEDRRLEELGFARTGGS